MINNDLNWYIVEREQLPGVLLGMELPKLSKKNLNDILTHQRSFDAIVGFMNEPSFGITPNLILVSKDKYKEIFSWIHTFSSETFPMSQFCRVMEVDEYLSFSESHLKLKYESSRKWSSLIVGEILTLGDISLRKIAILPTSWASNCYSLCIANALKLYSNTSGDFTHLIASRLRSFEDDARFLKNRNSIDILSPIWAMIQPMSLGDLSLQETISVVMKAFSPSDHELISSNININSKSAEKRVHGFHELSSIMETQRRGNTVENENRAGLFLAASALLAGLSTSHIGLLEPHARSTPSCLVWFGFLAGLAGPKSWDSDWLKLVLGVDRQLKSSIRLLDPIPADLTWREFEWLRSLSDSRSMFINLTRIHSKLLTVEVAPGVTIQLRFDGTDNQSTDQDHKQSVTLMKSISEQTSRIKRARHLALDLLNVLGDSPNEITSTVQKQPDLFLSTERAVRRSSRSTSSKKSAAKTKG